MHSITAANLLSMRRYACHLLIGAPGSGKGTQGKVLGTIPGYFHMACGEVFRALDLRTPIGRRFAELNEYTDADLSHCYDRATHRQAIARRQAIWEKRDLIRKKLTTTEHSIIPETLDECNAPH